MDVFLSVSGVADGLVLSVSVTPSVGESAPGMSSSRVPHPASNAVREQVTINKYFFAFINLLILLVFIHICCASIMAGSIYIILK